MQLKEPIDAVMDYYDYDPNTDPASCYDYYQNEHSDEYMHMADSNDKDNYIDFNKGTITVDGKTYSEEDMQLLHGDNHIYLLVEGQQILIEWLDYWIGKPYIY